jgi:hypothetical protein
MFPLFYLQYVVLYSDALVHLQAIKPRERHVEGMVGSLVNLTPALERVLH